MSNNFAYVMEVNGSLLSVFTTLGTAMTKIWRSFKTQTHMKTMYLTAVWAGILAAFGLGVPLQVLPILHGGVITYPIFKKPIISFIFVKKILFSEMENLPLTGYCNS
jgi:hypothetical protein